MLISSSVLFILGLYYSLDLSHNGLYFSPPQTAPYKHKVWTADGWHHKDPRVEKN